MEQRLRAWTRGLLWVLGFGVAAVASGLSEDEYYLPVADTMREFARNPYVQTHMFAEAGLASAPNTRLRWETVPRVLGKVGTEIAVNEDGSRAAIFGITVGGAIAPTATVGLGGSMETNIEPELGLKWRWVADALPLQTALFTRASAGVHVSSQSEVRMHDASFFVPASSFGPKGSVGVGIESRFATWFSLSAGVDGVARWQSISRAAPLNEVDEETSAYTVRSMIYTARPYLGVGTSL